MQLEAETVLVKKNQQIENQLINYILVKTTFLFGIVTNQSRLEASQIFLSIILLEQSLLLSLKLLPQLM